MHLIKSTLPLFLSIPPCSSNSTQSGELLIFTKIFMIGELLYISLAFYSVIDLISKL